MTNRQIQPVRARDYALARQARPRGLVSQFWTVALQPGYFFRTLPAASDTRQWFWAAILILALVGFSAVRQDAVLNGSGSSPSTSLPPDFGSGLPGTDLGGGVSSGFPGTSEGIPSDFGGGLPTDTGGAIGGTEDVSNTLITALIAASYLLLGWFIVSFLLCEVSLFNGVRPQLGQNLQIAIWTTVPLAIMAGLQVIYYSAGGKVGSAGLVGLLSEWKDYETLPVFSKSLILSLATHLTLFWVWSLFLLYRGARGALNGKRWAVIIVVVAWAIVAVVAPVLTGAISAAPPAEQEAVITDGNSLPFGDLGLSDPSQQADQLFSADGTLPPELDFLNDKPQTETTPSGDEIQVTLEATEATSDIPTEGQSETGAISNTAKPTPKVSP